jgi:hypothetical protein
MNWFFTINFLPKNLLPILKSIPKNYFEDKSIIFLRDVFLNLF